MSTVNIQTISGPLLQTIYRYFKSSTIKKKKKLRKYSTKRKEREREREAQDHNITNLVVTNTPQKGKKISIFFLSSLQHIKPTNLHACHTYHPIHQLRSVNLNISPSSQNLCFIQISNMEGLSFFVGVIGMKLSF